MTTSQLAKRFASRRDIFHGAALKQVPSCEFHPIEAVKTNVAGFSRLVLPEISPRALALVGRLVRFIYGRCDLIHAQPRRLVATAALAKSRRYDWADSAARTWAAPIRLARTRAQPVWETAPTKRTS